VGVGRAAHQCNISTRSEADGDGRSAVRFRTRPKRPVRLKGQGDMVKYLWTGAAGAAFLVMPIAAPAVDLSLTSIYQGRPVAAATGWALAERWTIYRGIETATVVPAPGIANNRQAWSTGAGYIMLTRWSLKGEYDYVNLLEPGVADTPASTTIAKTGMPLNRRTLKVGGNYDF
jgi:hypothetical protein